MLFCVIYLLHFATFLLAGGKLKDFIFRFR